MRDVVAERFGSVCDRDDTRHSGIPVVVAKAKVGNSNSILRIEFGLFYIKMPTFLPESGGNHGMAVWWSQIRPVQDSTESGTATVAVPDSTRARIRLCY